MKDDSIDVSITVSFGVSGYPSCVNSEEELLQSADFALYEAKKSGRNCVRVAKECFL
jgi:diguanylate cyclase (GGDEF)-like protein